METADKLNTGFRTVDFLSTRSVDQPSRHDAGVAELRSYTIDRPSEQTIAIGFSDARVDALEKRELVGCGVDCQRRKSDADEACRNTTRLAELGEQRARDLPDDAVGDHRRVERTACLSGLEVEVAHTNGDRASGEAVRPKVRGGARHEREEVPRQLVDVSDVGGKGLVAADALGFAMGFHLAGVDAAHAIEQPSGFARPEPLRQRVEVVLQHVGNAPHAERGKTLLKARPDEGDVREIERLEEATFVTGRHDEHAGGAAPRLGLGALDRELGDELGCAASDRDGQRRCRDHRITYARRSRRERLVAVQRFGAAEVEIPRVDACAFDHRRVSLEYRPDFAALLRAGAARDRDAHGVRTQAERAGNGHRRPDAELSCLVRRRTHDASAFPRAADDEQRRLPRPVGIDHSRHRHEERVGVGQEDAPCHRTCRSWTNRELSLYRVTPRVRAMISPITPETYSRCSSSLMPSDGCVLSTTKSITAPGVSRKLTSQSPIGTPNSSSTAAKNSSRAQLMASVRRVGPWSLTMSPRRKSGATSFGCSRAERAPLYDSP